MEFFFFPFFRNSKGGWSPPCIQIPRCWPWVWEHAPHIRTAGGGCTADPRHLHNQMNKYPTSETPSSHNSECWLWKKQARQGRSWFLSSPSPTGLSRAAALPAAHRGERGASRDPSCVPLPQDTGCLAARPPHRGSSCHAGSWSDSWQGLRQNIPSRPGPVGREAGGSASAFPGWRFRSASFCRLEVFHYFKAERKRGVRGSYWRYIK